MMIVVMVYYTYLDRLYFFLSNDYISHFDKLEIKEFMN